jgi:hypothetical protein
MNSPTTLAVGSVASAKSVRDPLSLTITPACVRVHLGGRSPRLGDVGPSGGNTVIAWMRKRW